MFNCLSRLSRHAVSLWEVVKQLLQRKSFMALPKHFLENMRYYFHKCLCDGILQPRNHLTWFWLLSCQGKFGGKDYFKNLKDILPKNYFSFRFLTCSRWPWRLRRHYPWSSSSENILSPSLVLSSYHCHSVFSCPGQNNKWPYWQLIRWMGRHGVTVKKKTNTITSTGRYLQCLGCLVFFSSKCHHNHFFLPTITLVLIINTSIMNGYWF